MLASFLRFLVWLLVIGGLVKLGWDDPLRYCFMSKAEITAEENPPLPERGPGGGPRRWEPRNTTLQSPTGSGL